MKYVSVNKKVVLASTILGVSLAFVPQASAEEIIIEISGNGSEATNQVQVNSSSQTQVTQTNDMNITNNVNVGANTGQNQANSNTGGDTVVSTGNATVDVNVANSGNTSQVSQDCCSGTGTGLISISGNGPYSQNSVNATFSNGLFVDVHNSANLVNNTRGLAITGKNDANYNLGDVLIKTGSIIARETVTNGVFNVANVSAGIKEMDFSVKIADNGPHSENNVVLENINENEVNIENSFNVVNDTSWELVTGENSANGNLGDVMIATGDISYESVITNSGNVSNVEISCCPPPAPVTPVNPPNPPSSVTPGTGGSGGSSDPGGSSGSTGPSSMGGILPVTGANFFFLFILLNMVFFLFGVFMKLRGGRSPSIAYSF